MLRLTHLAIRRPIATLATAIFGITMVDQGQLLQRTHDAYATGEDLDGALRSGLDGTAGAAKGDAFVVRPMLLPAAVEVLGTRSWWPTRRGARTIVDG